MLNSLAKHVLDDFKGVCMYHVVAETHKSGTGNGRQLTRGGTNAHGTRCTLTFSRRGRARATYEETGLEAAAQKLSRTGDSKKTSRALSVLRTSAAQGAASPRSAEAGAVETE